MSSALPYFHDAVSAWFGRTFPAPTPAQAQAWPAIQSGQDVLIAAPTGSGKTLAAFLAAIDELVREGEQWGLPERNARPVRLAAEGAVERHQPQPRSAAQRHSRGAAQAHDPRRRDPHLGSHRRHAAVRASADAAQAAAHRRHHARVFVHSARLGFGPRDARDDANGDRRRNSCGRGHEARCASRAVAGAARCTGRSQSSHASACRQRSSRLPKLRGCWSACAASMPRAMRAAASSTAVTSAIAISPSSCRTRRSKR